MATDADFKVKHGLVVTEDIELGHATDTTLSRSSGGVLAVEGVVVPTISSTSTLTNKTLTSPVLSGLIATTLTSGSEQVLISDTSDTTLVKIVQLGTGNAFEVHDQATDTSAFFANNAGKVGILKNPGSGLTYDVEIGGETLSERFTSSVTGLVGSPAFRFSGDTDTGMYNGGTNILAFTTGGTERMTISAAGVVNITGSLTVAGSAVGGASAINDLSDGKTQDLSIGLGTNALYQATSGQANNNVAVGANTGYAITIADNNTLVGVRAGSDIDANDNVAVGYQAFRRGTGSYNTAVGPYAGEGASGSSSGASNTYVGYKAGFAYTTGTRNIAIGANALDAANTESDNIAIGYDALGGAVDGGEKNIAIGNYALDVTTTGDFNVAIGHEASSANAGGELNTVIGYNAHLYITGTSNNTLIGGYAGRGQSGEAGGHDNVVVGKGAFYNWTTGAQNILLGKDAGYKIRSGTGNVVLGYQSHSQNWADGNYNTAVGYQAQSHMNGGANNISIGYTAGNNITTGDHNVVIGAADVASATGDSQLSISDGDGGTTWITGDSNGGVFQQAGLVAVSGNTTLTLAQSGAYIYWTAGTLTLPASGVVGTQYTVFNNTGGSATVALNASNCSIVSGWASNAAVADHDATSYVCVAANNWVQVGA